MAAFSIVGGLANLYSSCMTCFDQIASARRFDRNYEVCQCRLAVVQLRLARWSESVGIHGDDGNDVSRWHTLKIHEHDIPKAQEILGQIQNVFKAAEREGLKVDLMPRQEDREATKSKEGWYAAQFRKLASGRRKIQRATYVAKWAIATEQHYRTLIEDVNKLVDGLITTFPVADDTRRQTCGEDVVAILKARQDTGASREEICSEIAELQAATSEDPLLDEGLNLAAGEIRARIQNDYKVKDTHWERSNAQFGDIVAASRSQIQADSRSRYNINGVRATQSGMMFGNHYGADSSVGIWTMRR